MMSIKKNIVFTGAPSSGKSTTMARLATVMGNNLVIVPESAVVLLSGGFPAPEHSDLEQITCFQEAIIQVQTGLEMIFAKQNPHANLMIYDRGVLDGAGFWPTGVEDYYRKFSIDALAELAKYNYVLFFELPCEDSFGGVNRLRFHNYAQCLESEKKLLQVWQAHPNVIKIRATESFEDKIQDAISIILTLTANP